jgi:uncharacterized protein YlxW (UPF0749 family)
MRTSQSQGIGIVAKRRSAKSFLTWLLFFVCIALAALLANYYARAQRLERDNSELRKRTQRQHPQADYDALQRKVQQLQKEIEAKDQQIGDLEIRLKIYEKGSVKH